MKDYIICSLRGLGLAAATLLFSSAPAFAQGIPPVTVTIPSNVTVTILPEATITVASPTSALTSPSTFADFVGSTTITYKLRTSALTGSGSIQLSITTDFLPSGGPSLGSPLNVADKLTYTCAAAGGTPCSGTQTASTLLQTPVATFGADTHSPVSGSTGTVNWNLTNDPAYKPGIYTAIATFTISAT